MDGARRIPISSDSYFLGWLEPSDTLFVEERRKKGERERERERTGDAYVTNASSHASRTTS